MKYDLTTLALLLATGDSVPLLATDIDVQRQQEKEHRNGTRQEGSH